MYVGKEATRQAGVLFPMGSARLNPYSSPGTRLKLTVLLSSQVLPWHLVLATGGILPPQLDGDEKLEETPHTCL